MKRINQNNQKNNINNNINNNKNNNKKTRKKIIIPKIKDIQTTPDLSCMYPILEDNLVMCIHGGKVNLKAKNAKRIQSNNIPIMLNNEIQGASISGCLNPPILGGPCSKVALVFPYTFTQHQVNHKRAVLQMGLIGVSDKAYPILAIPKKNTIKFSPMKLKANPLDKIEYERIQWEGIKKEKEKKVESKSISSVVNQEQELPPNIIRIETLDESEEFIEIVLPPTFHIDDQPLMDVSTLFIPPALKGVGSTIKGIKGAGNAGKVGKSNKKAEIPSIKEVKLNTLPKETQESYRNYKNHKWQGIYPGQNQEVTNKNHIRVGKTFHNRDSKLPKRPERTYKEFDVINRHDPRRFVRDTQTGNVYYTEDHYQTFVKIIE